MRLLGWQHVLIMLIYLLVLARTWITFFISIFLALLAKLEREGQLAIYVKRLALNSALKKMFSKNLDRIETGKLILGSKLIQWFLYDANSY